MLVVNLFAGPGAGKSTLAAATFAALKQRGLAAELVTEVAKEYAWEGRTAPLRCQPYIFGQQMWRIERLRGSGVEVVVTDSPLLLSAIYAPRGTPAAFREAVRQYHNAEQGLNVWVRRAKPYDTRGRFQTEDEAREIDGRVREAIPLIHLSVTGKPENAAIVADRVEERLRVLERNSPSCPSTP